ncbi:MAG: DUF3987 domain-containing protein [Planctomycetes bacterium]|nr:DUF3987 domain-containing protein [Planctomycetota bacterium]
MPLNPDGSMPELWPDPIPLGSHVDPPPFPVNALPEILKDWSLANAEEFQCPVDLPASLALGALSCACGGWLEVQVRPQWVEPTNLYIAIALRSGEAKTPAFSRAVKAIRNFERAEAERLQEIIAELDTERTFHEERIQALKVKLRRPGKEDPEMLKAEMAEHLLDLRKLPIACSPRYLADDITQEQLGILMAGNGERMGLFSDEGGLFRLMAGFYNDGKANLDIYLKAFSGEGVCVDRVSRAAINLKRPCLTICLAVQPSVIQKLGETPEMRGHGLLARFMLVHPKSRVGFRNHDQEVAPIDLLDRYDSIITQLLERGRLGKDFSHPKMRTLALTRKAHEVIIRAQEEIEPRLAPGGDLFGYADWMNKSAGRIARIAASLHMLAEIESGIISDEISVECVENAKRLHDYYLDHAVIGLDMLGADPTVFAAQQLLAWVYLKGLTEFSKRDAMAGCRSLFRRVAQLKEPLALLEEKGWIRKVEQAQPRKPGRPSEIYLVHPAQNTQKPQNSNGPDSSVNFVNSVQGPEPGDANQGGIK